MILTTSPKTISKEDIEWRLQILTGTVPTKTSGYSNLAKRKEIINLYKKVGSVKFASKYKPSILFTEIKKRTDMVYNLCYMVLNSDEKVDIIYTSSPYLKFSFEFLDESPQPKGKHKHRKILVKMPVFPTAEDDPLNE